MRKYRSSGRQSCEICGRRDSLDLHHMRGRDIPNPDSPHNTVSLCKICHSHCHIESKEGYRLIVIEGWFNSTTGRELIWRHGNEESITGQECIPPLLIKQE